MKLKHVFFQTFVAITFIGCGSVQVVKDIPQLQEQYLGQRPPGNYPEVFAPGIVSDDSWAEHSQVAISPRGDEIFWSAWTSEYPSAEGSNTEQIFFTRFQNGGWTKPALAEFVKDHLGDINGGPVFSKDGEMLFFYSVNRPGGLGGMDTWYVQKTDGEWSGPVNVGEPYNTAEIDWTPTFSSSGYAYSNFRHLLRYEYSNASFSQPDTVLISGEYSPSFAIGLAPDESYVLFSAESEDGFGGLDLYLCFKSDTGEWGEPRNLGSNINTERHERFPVVSPDGKYLFFMRHTDSQDFFWVSTRIFDELRE